MKKGTGVITGEDFRRMQLLELDMLVDTAGDIYDLVDDIKDISEDLRIIHNEHPTPPSGEFGPGRTFMDETFEAEFESYEYDPNDASPFSTPPSSPGLPYCIR